MNIEMSISINERLFQKLKPLRHDSIKNENLSLFQKVLLITNGTVTDLLTIYTGESIRVKKLEQEIIIDNETEILNCPKDTPLLKRKVLLCSENNNYVYAESYFVFEYLSRSMQYKLLETDIPIGLQWKDEKIEMYREVIGYKIEPCGKKAIFFNTSQDTLMLSRSYSVNHNKKILGIITEEFPLTYFTNNKSEKKYEIKDRK